MEKKTKIIVSSTVLILFVIVAIVIGTTVGTTVAETTSTTITSAPTSTIKPVTTTTIATTATTAAPKSEKVLAGTVQVQNGVANITFSSAFPSVPTVVATPYQKGLQGTYSFSVIASSVTTTGATILVQYRTSDSTNFGNYGDKLNWIASVPSNTSNFDGGTTNVSNGSAILNYAKSGNLNVVATPYQSGLTVQQYFFSLLMNPPASTNSKAIVQYYENNSNTIGNYGSGLNWLGSSNATFSGSASCSNGNCTFFFPTPFNSIPIVVVSPVQNVSVGNYFFCVILTNVTTTGVDCQVSYYENNSTIIQRNYGAQLSWIAVTAA